MGNNNPACRPALTKGGPYNFEQSWRNTGENRENKQQITMKACCIRNVFKNKTHDFSSTVAFLYTGVIAWHIADRHPLTLVCQATCYPVVTVHTSGIPYRCNLLPSSTNKKLYYKAAISQLAHVNLHNQQLVEAHGYYKENIAELHACFMHVKMTCCTQFTHKLHACYA